MVLVTHEEEIAAFTERIIRFRDGEIISDETNIPHEPEFSRHVERNTDFEPEEVSGGKGASMLIENMKMAFSAIRINKMRSFLTMLGIIIGIGSVISIVSIGDTMRSMFADLYKEVGLTRPIYPLDIGWRRFVRVIILHWTIWSRFGTFLGRKLPIWTAPPAFLPMPRTGEPR